MQRTVIQNLKIALFALLLLVSVVFGVFAFLPENTPVEVYEVFSVSATPLSASTDTRYEVTVSGRIRNVTNKLLPVEAVTVTVDSVETPLTTDEPLQVNAVTVKVDGVETHLTPDEPLLLIPRLDTEIRITCIADRMPEKVQSVSVTLGGKATALRNPAVNNVLAYAAFPLVLSLVFLALTVHAVLVRLYMRQESVALSAQNAQSPDDSGASPVPQNGSPQSATPEKPGER